MTSPPRRIHRLLVANRGEIARRVMRTARERGIVCVAVYSDPDVDALFVQEADHAVALGGATSTETYLDQSKILAAAALWGCDAVHPGYGFLSENAEFAAAVQSAGLTWVGPSPESISAMAQKVPAKRLVAAAGVPLVPGAELAADVSAEDLTAAGARVGYPLMVKASAGGGGKGMRVVSEPAELAAAVATAAREAASAFGDATVFLERYLPVARHIEVQICGDTHGRVVHLFERECSIQRRHQKVVEEAPAARLAESTRRGLHQAAVAAAEAIDYVGAGTVEFLVDGEDYYFLEMNTRLQVEHPVTEAITGVDLVGWQLDVAEGARVPDPPTLPNGHAIEVRLYAEDPRHEDLPSTGTLRCFDVTDPRVRVDTGVATGSEVSPYYDPMLAKVIAHGRSRQESAARLAAGLRTARIHGVTTNRDMLVAILESSAFLDSVTTTAFLTEHPEVRMAAPDVSTLTAHSIAAAASVWQLAGESIGAVAEGAAAAGWRNVQRPGGISLDLVGHHAESLRDNGVTVHRRWRRDAGWQWGLSTLHERIGAHDDEVIWLQATVTSAPNGSTVRVVLADGARFDVEVSIDGDANAGMSIWVDDRRQHSWWQVLPRATEVDAHAAAGGPSAPVPGTITAVLVAPGDTVAPADTLVILEAMKMEHRIIADADGVISEVLVAVGDSIEAHQVVARMDLEESDE